MTKIILIRHGQTAWNLLGRYQGQSDIELSPEGRAQAQLLADNFPAEKIDAVYSSDLQRAYDTAASIAAVFKRDVVPRAGLREINFGCWEGLTYKEIEEKWPVAFGEFFNDPESTAIPEGETFLQVQTRGVQAIDEIIQRHPGQNIVVTAHGAIIRTILAEALHMPLRYIWSIRQDNTAVNIIRYDEGHRMIELLNSTAHLRK